MDGLPTIEDKTGVHAGKRETLLDAGLRLIDAGLPIVPVGADKDPKGVIKWRKGKQDYVVERMTSEEWADKWGGKPNVHGIAVLGSQVYGTVVIDVERPGMDETAIQAALQILPATCQQTTLKGGRHAYLVLTDGEYPTDGDNDYIGHLAEHPPLEGGKYPVLLAEVRAHAQYAVPLGPGRPPLPADFAPARITRQEYDKVCDLIRTAGTYTHKTPEKKPYSGVGGGGGGTGGIISTAVAEGSLSPLAVLPDGWEIRGHDREGRTYIRRPGAKSDTSGNVLGHSVVIHSTSVAWATPGKSMTPAETLARSRFGWDFHAAMNAVEEMANEYVSAGVVPESEHWADALDVLEAIAAGRGSGAGEPVTGPAPIDEANPKGYVEWGAFWADEVIDREPLIPQIVPRGGSAVIFSTAGVGKSLVMLDWAVQLVTGGEILGEPVGPVPVLYVDLEQDRTLVRERLEALGVGPETDLSRLHYSLLGDWAPMDTPEGGAVLVAEAERLGAALVVIDTASRVIHGGENDADTWLGFYRSTGRLLKAAGISLVRLDHAGKDPSKGARGSSAKDGDVDQVYLLSVPGAADRVDLKRTKNRLHLDTPDLIAMKREQDPLRHVHQNVDYAKEAAIWGVMEALDDADAAVDISRRDAAALLRGRGVKVRNADLGAAVKRRRVQAAPASGPHPHPYGVRSGGTTQPEGLGTTGDHSGTTGGPSGTKAGTTGKSSGPRASGTTSGGGGEVRCSGCAGALDPIHHEVGHHPGVCEPGGANVVPMRTNTKNRRS